MNLFLDADLDIKQALLDSLGVATCLAEMQGDDLVLIAMNSLFRKFYGLAPDLRRLPIEEHSFSEASGLTPEVFKPIVQRMRTNASLCIQTKKLVHAENSMPQSDGSEKWSRNTIAPVIRADDVACLLVSVVDITDIVQIQRGIEENLTRLIGQHVCVCPGCSRIENEQGEWVLPETFMAVHGSANFSHGICPSCKAGFR